jgi:hypothetical protein
MAITAENITFAEPTSNLGRSYDIRVGGMTGKHKWSVYLPLQTFSSFSTREDMHWLLTEAPIKVFPYPEMAEYKGAQLSWSLWYMDPKFPEDDQEVGIIMKYPTNLDRRHSTPLDLEVAEIKMVEAWGELELKEIRLRLTEAESVDHFNRAKARGSKRGKPCLKHIAKEVQIERGLINTGSYV